MCVLVRKCVCVCCVLLFADNKITQQREGNTRVKMMGHTCAGSMGPQREEGMDERECKSDCERECGCGCGCGLLGEEEKKEQAWNRTNRCGWKKDQKRMRKEDWGGRGGVRRRTLGRRGGRIWPALAAATAANAMRCDALTKRRARRRVGPESSCSTRPQWEQVSSEQWTLVHGRAALRHSLTLVHSSLIY